MTLPKLALAVPFALICSVDTGAAQLSWSTESTQPARFVAVHGRRAALFGYSENGLEGWAYPIQIFNSLTVSFKRPESTTLISGQAILRRVIYSPYKITRIYAGPGFVVREKLFVPLELAGATLSYEVEGTRPIDVVMRFNPVLDLMWPGSLGGQEVGWDSAASAYFLTEGQRRFAATIGSPDVIAHDELPNATRFANGSPGVAFTVRATQGHAARVIIAGAANAEDPAALSMKLLSEESALEEAAASHYDVLLDGALQIETPDSDVNRALQWSEIALDQAWVCAPGLGCGEVAGYGPSRKARRPQYDWFFAGDGLVAVHALLATSQFERARRELELIFKYQDRGTGMVWHELSQSASVIAWDRYPYMFVHVDVTFDFLQAVAEYYSVTGDGAFVRSHWAAIESAYKYCRSVLDPSDHLPRIPGNKQGPNEQDPLSDELALSAAWVGASRGFADLAAAVGHVAAARAARSEAQHAIGAIASRYWDPKRNFFISGYTRSGSPTSARESGVAGVLQYSPLSAERRDSVLDQLASSDFQTDWGSRSKAPDDKSYDPSSYASGSVWALGSSLLATVFWTEHRPASALPIWSGLVQWASLDSLGHMHETLAGDYYREGIESVPEQTWSSASFLSATVRGLLGLTVDGIAHRLTFGPHLPPGWKTVRIRHVRVGDSDISINMTQSSDEIALQMHNEGAPFDLVFDPQLPLGARLRGARALDSGRAPGSGRDRPIDARLEQNGQDTHARVELTVPHGDMSATIGFSGGIAIVCEPPHLEVGEPSKAVRIVSMSLAHETLTMKLDRTAGSGDVRLRTPWTVQRTQGADVEPEAPSLFKLTHDEPQGAGTAEYRRDTVVVTFAAPGR